ncbi:LuxR C-terminal-related transcriptional regulator [Microvirga roseola]|uniref:LuxR C-terminal-related transcriptional regulator n=1 Tax=Microvirga roseola TaxID=2883126 RepID=UPI001E4454E2|nr:response regulator transcription factor [Microvirga roseola]
MSDTTPVSTILGCKNAMLREGLKHILSKTRFKVQPFDLSHSELELQAPESEHVLFIIDSKLYPAGIADAVKILKEQCLDARVVVLADGFDLGDMMASFQSGADGYCLATIGCDALIKYLDLVMLGEVVFPSALFLSALSPSEEAIDVAKGLYSNRIRTLQVSQTAEAKDSPIRTLSSREAEILQCLMQGAPNKVIARKLDVAEATVKVHIKAILRKIRVANRTQAAMWAVNHLPAPAGSSEVLAAAK